MARTDKRLMARSRMILFAGTKPVGALAGGLVAQLDLYHLSPQHYPFPQGVLASPERLMDLGLLADQDDLAGPWGPEVPDPLLGPQGLVVPGPLASLVATPSAPQQTLSTSVSDHDVPVHHAAALATLHLQQALLFPQPGFPTALVAPPGE
eukprot:CAMPEP_0179069418 /NCGR_PEP_ID=MMETSP0796-20121207/30497_1 /TAXON_ID=73915 /ORGANISM="Pyrodinium bahamense, Strain pbaha01" /LENGTH=150 /DNA_ID=CAMNT_0020766483 /DNA_START=271 /DNA_END=724 /DNA_ORIENTATION=-